MNDLLELSRDLVLANRILAHEGVVDAFGHVSVRHPHNPQRYLLSQSKGPALVSLSDLMEFNLQGEPSDQKGRPMYSERFIHGGIYQARDDVRAVVHNHSLSVIPFSVTGTPLRPIFHVGATVGAHVPVWDIRTKFRDTSLLVTNMEQANDLAAGLGNSRVALMRGHGCVVAGQSLREVVVTSVYSQVNARLLLESLPLGNVTYLSEDEIQLMSEALLNPPAVDRVWEYWVTRADCQGL